MASRIGAVRGDVLGIDIIERVDGRALDELTVRLPGDYLVPLLIEEVGQVDGVVVEDVQLLSGPLTDPRLDALEAAATLVDQPGSPQLLAALADQSCRLLAGDWAVVAEVGGAVLASAGRVADEGGQAGVDLAYQTSTGSPGAAPGNVARSGVPGSRLEVVLHRAGRPIRERERRYLVLMARIAGVRWTELEAVRGTLSTRAEYH